MAIRVGIHHRTRYDFDRRVNAGPHVVRLRPAPHCRTPIHNYSLSIAPEPHFLNWQQDPFGNYLARLVFPEPLRTLEFNVDVVADLTVINPFDFFLESYADEAPFEYADDVSGYLAPYLAIKESGPLLMQWLKRLDKTPRRTVDFLVEVNRVLQQDVAYSVRMEPGVQSCETTLETRIGSCRDTGWLLVQILRHLGLAARFVSGYLVQLKSDEKSLDGPSGPEKDFTDLHAWSEVYIPGAGWIGLDPTSGLLAGEGHIPLACTPDPPGAAPITGAVDPCEVTFHFSNSIERVHEDPRVTLPFSEDAWARINALGGQVDADLEAQDVKLTMGGEPTFVSIDDMESEQWNTAALGEHKLELAHELAARLKARYADGGFMHYAQGKWYPGEVLPRWAMTCYWRTDGVPLWRDPALQASKEQPRASDADAGKLARALATALALDAEALVPGFEDTLYYLWREGTLPPEVDLDDDAWSADVLGDPLERQRLRKVLAGKLGRPVGHALPVEYVQGRWRTEQWRFSRDQMYLIPGDSPMGYRLPLTSLRWDPAVSVRPEADPFAPHGALPGPGEPIAQLPGHAHEPVSTDAELVRTALCVEQRDGMVHVFLPPLEEIEAAVRLVSAIELAARNSGVPVRIEGYPLPADPRLRHFQVTPDPGVIEVNVQPSSSWEELRELTETLYEEARECRLGTEKFMLDGRHTGTGGGNHVTLGAAQAADSPLLRRPDLLASLVTYWQHHPSLSYMFSGAFIGPTSQAPRVDEARDETLYELEVALHRTRELNTGPGRESDAPWLVDRIFRNLLIDVTGNTHRAEFCIDKLYDPGSASGRRGLLELRAFEMPPHARMSLLQMLLVRALVAWMWREPYRLAPARWGSALHDRFLLPHHVWNDLRRVLRDLGDAGYPFDWRWFETFMEFRFPRHGTTFIDNMMLELRFAIEPWNVLGEEAGALGTSRYVDSSVERLQVRITDFSPERYVLLCNGQRVPLRETAEAGEFVAGVRYKAWNPPSALHPTIEVDSPLVFDVVDIASGRPIGGCRYHVEHPGGRNPDDYPVNAAAAEARRVARFEALGHSPGVVPIPPLIDNPHLPHTLDLRSVD